MWRYLHGSVLSSAPANYASVVLTDHPVGYWRMDAASGTTELDRSGNGNSGTITGGVTLNQAGAIADGDAAELFDGSSGYLTMGNVAALTMTGGPLSIECWATIVAGTVNAGLCGTSITHGYMILWNNKAQITFYAGDGNTTNYALSDTAWHHFVGTWDGTTNANGIKFYVDGALKQQGTAVSASLSATGFTIGRDINQGFFNGSIDEVSVYNVALTPAQILNHYTVARN